MTTNTNAVELNQDGALESTHATVEAAIEAGNASDDRGFTVWENGEPVYSRMRDYRKGGWIVEDNRSTCPYGRVHCGKSGPCDACMCS